MPPTTLKTATSSASVSRGQDVRACTAKEQIEALDPEMVAVLRRKTPAERLEMANEMWRFAFRMAQAQVKRAFPGATVEEVSRETARRMANGSW